MALVMYDGEWADERIVASYLGIDVGNGDAKIQVCEDHWPCAGGPCAIDEDEMFAEIAADCNHQVSGDLGVCDCGAVAEPW